MSLDTLVTLALFAGAFLLMMRYGGCGARLSDTPPLMAEQKSWTAEAPRQEGASCFPRIGTSIQSAE